MLGVMPRRFGLPGFDAWVVVGPGLEDWMLHRRNHPGLLAVGRLAEGASIEQARSDEAWVDREPAAELPVTNRDIRAVLTSRDRRGDRPPGDPVPRREIGVRLALGAKPAAVVRGFVTEAMTPIAIGLGLGLAAALALSSVMARSSFRFVPPIPAPLPPPRSGSRWLPWALGICRPGGRRGCIRC
jgi:hypothetical protein